MLMLNCKRNSGSQQQAPVPPQRHSSIRANAPLTPPTHMANASHQFGSSGGLSSNGGGGVGAAASVGRLVIDLETKFGKRFHNVTEFPKPPPFLNIQKIYPSRTFKATNANMMMPSNNNNNSAASTNLNTNRKPAYAPLKKHRAPLPPAGVAAATVSVIRQSSFLYGGATAAGNSTTTTTNSNESQPAGSVPRNSTVY